MYAEFLSKSIVSKNGDDIIIRMVQENNYSESFPRQVLEMTIQGGDFSKDNQLTAFNSKY